MDLLKCTPEQLAAYAHKAFLLGMLDGMQRTTPRTGEMLMAELFPPDSDWRIFHRHKFRQTYGAGFDMARMTLYTDDLDKRTPALPAPSPRPKSKEVVAVTPDGAEWIRW